MLTPVPPQLPGHLVRVGCDVATLSEIDDSLTRFGNRFLSRIYTGRELADCDGPNRLARLAARFAAKEAAIKAFDRPDAAFVPQQIEVFTTGGAPTLRLTGAAAVLAAEQHWQRPSVSLTHADCHAAAVVVVVCAAQPSANALS